MKTLFWHSKTTMNFSSSQDSLREKDQDEQKRPAMAPWLLPVLVAVAMVIFLIVSFCLHHKRFLQQRRRSCKYYVLQYNRVSGPVLSLPALEATLMTTVQSNGDSHTEDHTALTNYKRKLARGYTWSPRVFKAKLVKHFQNDKAKSLHGTSHKESKGDSKEAMQEEVFISAVDTSPFDFVSSFRPRSRSSTKSHTSRAELVSLRDLIMLNRSNSYRGRSVVVTTSTGALAVAKENPEPSRTWRKMSDISDLPQAIQETSTSESNVRTSNPEWSRSNVPESDTVSVKSGDFYENIIAKPEDTCHSAVLPVSVSSGSINYIDEYSNSRADTTQDLNIEGDNSSRPRATRPRNLQNLNHDFAFPQPLFHEFPCDPNRHSSFSGSNDRNPILSPKSKWKAVVSHSLCPEQFSTRPFGHQSHTGGDCYQGTSLSNPSVQRAWDSSLTTDVCSAHCSNSRSDSEYLMSDLTNSLKIMKNVTKDLQTLYRAPSSQSSLASSSKDSRKKSKPSVCERCQSTQYVLNSLNDNDMNNISEFLDLCEKCEQKGSQWCDRNLGQGELSYLQVDDHSSFKNMGGSSETLAGSWQGSSCCHGYLDTSLTSLHQAVSN